MESNVIEIARWLLIGFQLEQANLRDLGICQNWRACWHILLDQPFSIQVVQNRHDLPVYQSKVFRAPGVSGTSCPFQDTLRISVGPGTQTSMQMKRFEGGIGRQQVAEMMEQALSWSWSGGLGKL